MWKDFKSSKFYKNWINFFQAFFSPWPLILLILSGVSVYLSIAYKENRPFSVVITIIAALFSGLAGTFIKDEFGNLMLEKKGRSAVRNLQSINQQIFKIRDWIFGFLKDGKQIKENLEEVDRHLSMTEFNVQSAIEDWVDVVPELAIFSNLLKFKETELLLMKQKFTFLEKKMLKSKDSEEIKQKLGEQKKLIKNLEEEIKNIKQSAIVSSSSSSPAIYTSSKNMSVSELEKQIESLLKQITDLQGQLIEPEKPKQ